MRTTLIRAALFLLLAAALLCALPVFAWTPSEGSTSAPASDVAPQWVPTGMHPGFYAARDSRNLDPTEYKLVGGHQSFYWDELEPTEGNYVWAKIDNFVGAQAAKGKRAAIGIMTFNGRANQNNPTNPAYRVPSWVVAPGNHQKIVLPDGFEIPRYWDSVYKTKYRNFIHALAQHFQSTPSIAANVEFIQIGVGKFGETQPCDDGDDAGVITALQADGLTQWSWGAFIVNDITDIYADNFPQTNGVAQIKLVLPNAPTFGSDECGRKTWTDHAIARGVGLFPAEMYPIPQWVDLRTKTNWDGCGKLDRILSQVDASPNDQPWVPVAFEGYDYMVGTPGNPDPAQFFWGVAAELSRRADYITLERNVLYAGAWNDPVVTPYTANLAVMDWAGKYLGHHVASEPRTPSVWVLMRETGYCYGSGCSTKIYPQVGNYSFWLLQDDTISQGKTVPTTYLSRDQTVLPAHWTSYGTSCTNPNLEVGQTFLRGTGDSGLTEGWITRRTNQGSISGDRYMYFKIDDRYRSDHPGNEATISVSYLDRGTDTWQLQYDSTGGGAYKVAKTVTKTNSGRWKTEIISLTDARFLNGELGAADFRLDCMGDGDEYIHMVDVTLGVTGPTPTPTETSNVTPTETLTPSITPTPSTTLTPSNTPDVTPTPVIVELRQSNTTVKDTWISSYAPTTNYGAGSGYDTLRLKVGAYRTLISFDTSSIPAGATVRSAKLYLYLNSYDDSRPTVSSRVSVYHVKRPWVELETTWQRASAADAWQTYGCDGSNDRDSAEAAYAVVQAINTWYSWDLTTLVQDWVGNSAGNQGLLLSSDMSREFRFWSSNYSQNQPYLRVEYTGGSGGTTPTATATPTGTPSVGPTPVSTQIAASQDTYIDQGNPSTTHENQWLHTQGVGLKRPLVNFDLSSIPPAAEIISATLRLTASTYSDGKTNALNVGAYAVNKTWLASQATWNAASTGNAWTTAGCENVPLDRAGTPAATTAVQAISGSHPWEIVTYDWDVTSIIRGWMSNPSSQAGMILIAQDANYRDFAFMDSSSAAANHPLLIVWYRPATATPTATPPGATLTPTPTATPSGSVTPTPTGTMGSIGGVVFNDLNGNARRDGGEPGLAGAVVELWLGQTLISAQTTSGSGAYSFDNLASGTIFTIKQTVPAGYLPSPGSPIIVPNVMVFSGHSTEINFADYDPNRIKVLALPILMK